MSRPILMILLLGAVLTACGGAGELTSTPPPTETPASPSPDPSDEPTDAPTDTPDPTPSDAPTPSPSTADIPLDTVVETIAEGLALRHDPGTAGERIGFLSLGTVAFVLAGPQEMDGIPWYRVAGMGVPYGSGCVTTPPNQPIACPALQGWVAGASEAGDPWIAATDREPCPEPDVATISETGFTWRLVCWADEPITLQGWWPETPDDSGLGGSCPSLDEPGGYLHCQGVNENVLLASPQEGTVARVWLSIDPASGLAMPERGQWVRVTGQFDHPDAQHCADLADPEWEDSHGAVFACRREFVPTSIEALGG